MSTEIIAPQDSLPIDLTTEEINDPRIIIAEFFSADDVNGHLKELREWRNCVLEERYYINQKNNPSGILFTYRINVKLIIAANLLLVAHEHSAITPFSIHESAHLVIEKKSWDYYPQELTEEELLNPLLVIARIFKDYSLIKYRSLLYDWLENALSSRGALEALESIDIVRIYENLQKLYAAAWLIHQRSSPKQNSFLNNGSNGSGKINRKDIQYCCLNPIIEDNNQKQIIKLVSVIRSKVTTVQAIIYMGRTPQPNELIYLFIIVHDDDKRQIHEISCTIDDACKEHASVMALVHHQKQFIEAVKDGNRFFSQATSCLPVYLSGELLIPLAIPKPVDAEESVLEKWNLRLNRSMDFLKGAEFYLNADIGRLALFSLHQAVENALRSIIARITGYRVNIHNIDILMKLTLMFTPDLLAPFQTDTEPGQQLFCKLQSAYVDTRYKDSFEIDIDSVKQLYEIVKDMLQSCDLVLREYVFSKNTRIAKAEGSMHLA